MRAKRKTGQSAHVVLLLHRKSGKGTVLRAGFSATMVAHRKGEQFPLFVAPSCGDGQAKEKLARGLLRRLFGMSIANAVQTSRGQ